ncbi:MAG: hypothetical protein ACK5T6_08585 [Pirellula sp.]
MKPFFINLLFASIVLFLGQTKCYGHDIKRDVSYSKDAHARKKLDMYIPLRAKKLPVVVWIHGGGWQTGDKSEVHIKPKFFNEFCLSLIREILKKKGKNFRRK